MRDALGPFETATLKLRRARRHLEELRGAVDAFMLTKPFALMVEQPDGWHDQGSNVWVVRLRQSVPIEFGPIIGDVVHSLRSSLDLMATDLVRLNGGRYDKTYFPFAINAEQLEGQIKDKVRNAHPDVIDLIRSFKPYTGGNLSLRALHDLDIQDKHQALIPSVSAARTNAFLMRYGGAWNQIPEWNTAVPHDGWWMASMPAMANLPLGSEVSADFALVFEPDSPFSGHEVVPTLGGLADYVASVIEAFATLCKGQRFPEGTPRQPTPTIRSLIVAPTDDPDAVHRLTRIR